MVRKLRAAAREVQSILNRSTDSFCNITGTLCNICETSWFGNPAPRSAGHGMAVTMSMTKTVVSSSLG
jgi:hypothetical protein